jgi:hypothetical protein
MSKLSFNPDQRGAFMAITAGIILFILILCGFALDGAHLMLARLWAQRAADAGAFSGGGLVALRSDSASNAQTGDTNEYCREVGRVALLNLEERGVLARSYNIPDSSSGCTFSLSDPHNTAITISPTLSSSSKTISVNVSFDSPFLLVGSLPGFGTLRRVAASAQSQIDPVVLSILVDTSQSMTQSTSTTAAISKIAQLKNSLTAILPLFDTQTDSLNLISFGSRANVEVPFRSGGAYGFNRDEFVCRIRGLSDTTLGGATACANAGISSAPGLQAGGDTNYTDALTKAAIQMTQFKSNFTGPAPTYFDLAQVGYLVFGDGAPTAATLALNNSKTALPDSTSLGGQALTVGPCTLGSKYYTVWGGDAAGYDLLPFRMVAASNTFDQRANDDISGSTPSLIPGCSTRTSDYNAGQAFGSCLNTLGFNYGCPPVAFAAPTAGYPLEQFERITQVSALLWADYLREAPKRSLLMVVGLGAPVPAGCGPTTNAYENESCSPLGTPPTSGACGSLCTEFRKDRFLSRLAGTPVAMGGLEYPDIPTSSSIPEDKRGRFWGITDQDALVDTFAIAATFLKLRMVN